MSEAASWYLALLVVGLAGMLPAVLLFERMASGGVLYARVIGLATVTLAAWLLGWSGLIAYGRVAVLIALAGLVAWSAAIGWRRRDLLGRVVERRGLLLGGEAVVLVVFVLVTLARMQAPDAVHTEKPMDLMLLIAVERAEQLPPPDPWLAGETLSYYHLGHTSLDVIGTLSGNGAEIAFNLGVAMAGALAAAAALGLIVDVIGLSERPRRRAVVAGGAAGLGTLLLAAPVVGLVNLLAANGLGGERPWGLFGVEGVPMAEGTTRLVPDGYWWWWSTTRVLAGTITEFPAFTLLLGDPHAHLLALPLVFVILALAVQTLGGETPLTWRRWLRAPDVLALTAVLFAALVMTNAWDLVTLGPVWGLAAIASARRAGWAWQHAPLIAVRWAALPAVVALALAWPFLGGLDAPPLGVAPVTGEQSNPLHWLLVWLPPLLPAAFALWVLGERPSRRELAVAGVAVVLVVSGWVVLAWGELGSGVLSDRTGGWVVVAGLVVLAVYVGARAVDAERGLGVAAARETSGGPLPGPAVPDQHYAPGRPQGERGSEGARLRAGDRGLGAALALLGVGVVILLALELVRIDDAFPGRVNTVFKFGFQVWAILAVAGGALMGIAVGRMEVRKRRRPLLMAGSALAVALVLLSLYTPAMGVSRGREEQARGISATAFLERRDPALAAAIEWSRVQLDPREHVIAQAVGESYTEGNRLSTHSAVPALLAWPNHERQWRGEIAEFQRRAALDAIYAGSADEAARAIERWRVTHVLIGPQERATYGGGLDERFAGWPVAFELGEVRIVEARPPGAPGGGEGG